MSIFQFIPEDLRTAPYLLPITKLLVSTKLKFSAVFSKTFCGIFQKQPFRDVLKKRCSENMQ